MHLVFYFGRKVFLRDNKHAVFGTAGQGDATVGRRGGQIEQRVAVHGVVLVAVQCIHPVAGVHDTCRMLHTHRTLLHGIAFVLQSFCLGSHPFLAKNSRQHRHQPFGQHGTRGHLLAREHGDIGHRTTFLQHFLAPGDIAHKVLCLRHPSLVALEEKSDSIERHARTTVGPWVMRIDMEEQTVHAQCEIPVEQGFYAGGGLVPYTANLGESLGLHDILAIHMSSADGIKHVVGFVVSR